MAVDSIHAPTGWRQIRRETKLIRPTNFVRIRRSGDLAFSSGFVRSALISESTRANIFVSECGYRIGISFHCNDADKDSFQVSKDGGNKMRDTSGRVIQSSSLKKQSEVFAKTLLLPDSQREFEPRKDINGLWVIELRPAFESVYHGKKAEIPSGVTGIYRYLLDNEIVYVGRGRFNERFSSSERDGWSFDKIEYSVLNDTEAEIRWESYWLDSHRNSLGRLPLYNRIAGQSHKMTVDSIGSV